MAHQQTASRDCCAWGLTDLRQVRQAPMAASQQQMHLRGCTRMTRKAYLKYLKRWRSSRPGYHRRQMAEYRQQKRHGRRVIILGVLVLVPKVPRAENS